MRTQRLVHANRCTRIITHHRLCYRVEKSPSVLVIDLTQNSQFLAQLKTTPSPFAARFFFARSEGHFSGARRVFNEVFSAPVANIRRAKPSLAVLGPISSEDETWDGAGAGSSSSGRRIANSVQGQSRNGPSLSRSNRRGGSEW